MAGAAEAVFRSWDAPKAVSWRRLNGLDDAAGTAVTVQTMVFGNAGGTSGAGVGFTRDPATGEPALYFDFCCNGQGEDVVAGRRTLADNDRLRALLPDTMHALEDVAPGWRRCSATRRTSSSPCRTGRLFLLQTRRAQRTPLAGAAHGGGHGGGRADRARAKRCAGWTASTWRRSAARASRRRCRTPLAQAVVAGVGVASGPVALDAAAAARFAGDGTPAILVRPETLTADIAGLAGAAGLLTAAGSRTAHAAVVARQLGKVCLVGCAGPGDRPGAAALPDRRDRCSPRATRSASMATPARSIPVRCQC